MSRMASDAMKSNDGSYIGVQTSKGHYTGGEMLSGFVVLQNNSVRQVDRVLLKVSLKERTYWDEEVAHTRSSGEGENRKTWTEYQHFSRSSKVTHCKDLVVASMLPHMLAPGAYSYPFSYPLRADLPGTARFSRRVDAADPAWRNAGRQLVFSGEVVCKVKAFVDVSGIFSRDLRCVQEIVVNPAFNWGAMQPARGDRTGTVLLLCCIPRGSVTLSAAFDRAAYMAGETAGIRAAIKNDSEQDVQKMSVKLVRSITLRDHMGNVKLISDVMCRANYPGVEKHSEAPRDMPLALLSNHGPLLPGTRGRLVEISYAFQVSCDLSCAPDIEVHLPMIIFAPQPQSWGLAALGLPVPQGIHFDFALAPPPSAAPQLRVNMPQGGCAWPFPFLRHGSANYLSHPPHTLPPLVAFICADPPQQQQQPYPPMQQGMGGYPPSSQGYPPGPYPQ